jgi:hypothetical protein
VRRQSRRSNSAAVVALLAMLATRLAPADARRIAQYEPAVVELEGRLISEERFGPPNFGETPEIDARIRVVVLRLNDVIDVVGNPSDALNATTERDVVEVQLVFADAPIYDDAAFYGKPVSVRGRLFHSFTGHHARKVHVLEIRARGN